MGRFNPRSGARSRRPDRPRAGIIVTVAFPSYDGDGMYLSMGNLLAEPHVGLLFIDFVSACPTRRRLNGVAGIDELDPLIDEYPGAQCHVWTGRPRSQTGSVQTGL